jgi:hypothetical protein
MKRFLAASLVGCTLFSFCGCGGLTQEDMNRNAIRRPNDDDEGEKPVGQPKQNDSVPSQDETKQKAAIAPAKTKPRADSKADDTPSNTDAQEESFDQPEIAQFPRVNKPTEPLALNERRQRTIDNMTKIGAAIAKHIEEKRSIPPAAILSSSGRPLLSWRVGLLPYLGYEALYKQFRLEEPWDSPHNRLLLPFIPREFQSPDRFDDKTNYLAPIASFTAFQGKRGMGIRKIEDGLENTVVVVEVDDDSAVPWTKPHDLDFNLYRLDANVGNLRQDGFFVVWGTGEVTRIRPDATDAELRSVFTIDAGEPISSFAIRADATAEPAVDELPADEAADSSDGASETRVARRHKEDDDKSSVVADPGPTKWPIPDEMSMGESKRLFREIYQQEYDSARTAKEKEQLAKKLLKEANRMREDYAGRYVLLEIIMKIATQAGDAQTTLDAADQLTSDYEVDALTLKRPAVETLIKNDERGRGADAILEAAGELIDLAIERDDYEAAESLCGVAIAAARKNNNRREALQMEKRKYQVRDAKKAFVAMRRAVEKMDGDDDPEANLEVGRYYCLVKADWAKGLPLLAGCCDAALRDLAEQELKLPTIPIDQLRLADGWWMLAEKRESHEKALQLRAAYWYLQALSELPHGLHRVKAEMRVRQAEDK